MFAVTQRGASELESHRIQQKKVAGAGILTRGRAGWCRLSDMKLARIEKGHSDQLGRVMDGVQCLCDTAYILHLLCLV